MMPAGLMNVLADAFALPVPRIGALIWAGAIAMGLGAPLLAWAGSRIDRRSLLVGALALYVAGHLLSAAAPSFEALLGARLITVLGAAVFTPQAAAALGVLLPLQRRPAGITFAFLGWSLAAAFGMPLGSWFGSLAGWRMAYLLEAAMALAAAVAVARTLPVRVMAPGVGLRTWLAVARHPALPLLLAVTVAQTAGQFALSSYTAPELRRRLDASPELIALLFALFGLCGVLGNVVVSRLMGRVRPDRALLATMALMAAGLFAWSVGGSWLAAIAGGMALWGLGCFASNSLQQARLIAAQPSLAPASVALNSSGLYVGQAIGALSGGALIAAGVPAAIAPMGLVIMLGAIAVSVRAARAERLAAA